MTKKVASSFYNANSLLRNARIVTKEGNVVFSVASKEALLKKAVSSKK